MRSVSSNSIVSLRTALATTGMTVGLLVAACGSDSNNANNNSNGSTCGDNVLDLGEDCDPPDGVTCDVDCTFLNVGSCGDGTVDPGEQCDDGGANSDTTPDACRTTCTNPGCGDNVTDTGEDCDPPDGVTCDTTCLTLLTSCGDGVLDPGEQCDDGNNTPGDGCDANCQNEPVPVCGDGNVDPGEQCDDGNTTSGDGCDANCQNETTPVCGDGVLDPGEQCDDGNTTPGDGCDAACAIEPPPSCGDGNVDHANGEECDDGNTADNDGCSAACLVEVTASCGDGVLDFAAGEECDDGNIVGGDGCSATCQLETIGQTCGNGTLEGLEVCDDGNTQNGDGCSPTCNNTNSTGIFVGQLQTPGFADDPAGAGTALISGSATMAVDNTYLYFTDPGNNRVRRVRIATRVVDTIAGNGSAGWTDNAIGTNASFDGMEGIATDGFTLWVGDQVNCVIRAIDLNPPFAASTVAGSGVCANHVDGIGAAAEFAGLRALTYWNGLVYLLNPGGPTLRTFDPVTGQVTTVAGVVGQMSQNDGNGLASGPPFGEFISPRYITHDNSGVIYIADTNGNKIRSYNTVTDFVGTLCGTGVCGYVDGPCGAAEIRRPRGMASDGTSVYWVEFNENTIRQATLANPTASTLAGTLCGGPGMCLPLGNCPGSYAQGIGVNALFDRPFDVVFHFPTNTLFVADGGNSIIRTIQ